MPKLLIVRRHISDMISLRFRKVACLASIAASACTIQPPIRSMTQYNRGVATHSLIMPNGAVVSNDFYSHSLIDDPRWELYRLQRAMGGQFSNARLLRRDVRWYPSPFGPRDACAAVFYTLALPDATPEELVLLENGRLHMLADEPIGTEPVRCSHDGQVWSLIRSAEGMKQREKQLFVALHPRATCAGRERNDAIMVRPLERVSLRVRVHPKIEQLSGAKLDDGERLARVTKAAFNRALFALRKAQPVFVGARAAKHSKVSVVQTVALNSDGSSYCVRLTVRRGAQTWSHAVYRAGLALNSRAPKTDAYGRSKDPAFWTPVTDAVALSEAFAATIGAEIKPQR